MQPNLSTTKTLEFGYAQVNGVRLHHASTGSGDLMIFLHGFPQFWYAWRHQLSVFGRTHRAVAPDMRGYNLSSKPSDVEAYALPILVEDVAALMDHFGHRTATLVGHDWGGVVAWEFAHAHPDRVKKLVIINAPHPAIFGRELAHNPAQQQASQYIRLFRSAHAEDLLTANNFARLVNLVIAPGRRQGYFSQPDEDAYIAAWSQPGAITGSLNYYRAADFVPGMADPDTGENDYPIFFAPTLIIWGEQDDVLLPGNLNGIEQYAPNVVIERVPNATHAIIHEQPEVINALIQRFLES